MTFVPFIGLQMFIKVKLLCENSLWSNIFNYLKIKVTPKIPHSCIFFSKIVKKWKFWQTYLFSLGLADDQKSFNAACNNIFLHFCAAIMDFSIILKCSVFFLPIIHKEDSNKNKPLKAINKPLKTFSHFLEFTVEQVLKSF